MERMLVAIFDSEDKAHEASRALQRLSDESIIGVYADGIVAKDRDGETTLMKTHDAMPQGTMGGAAMGSLIGLLGGPIGLAVGAVSGFAIGAAADLSRARVGNDFVKDVADALLPGKSALVAQIDEEVTDRVDSSMEALGGRVFRRALWDLEESERDAETAALNADIAQTEAEHAASRVERKAALQARLDTLNKKLRQALARAKASRGARQRDAAAKAERLQEEASDARDAVDAVQKNRSEAVRRATNNG